MYREHPHIRPLPAGATLWRYIDFTKFMSMLEKKAVFFSRVDKLGDPFEGSFPKENVEIVRSSFNEPFLADLYKDHMAFIEKIRPFVLVNCWHDNTYESFAMWAVYSGIRNGIAIKTDFESLSNCFTCDDAIFIGKVGYIDFDSAAIRRLSDFAPFFYKRKDFEFENEVRALNLDLPIPRGLTDPNLPLEPLDLSRPLHEIGTYRGIDPAVLIQELIVGPLADDWFVELVKSVAHRYCLDVPVNKSTHASSPRW